MPRIKAPDGLTRRQLKSFGIDDSEGLTSARGAERFLKRVGIALRYWGSDALPMASLYQACLGSAGGAPPKMKGEPGRLSLREAAQRMAIELTNHLLATHQGIEVSVIASRISLVHRDLVPCLYVLVRNHLPVSDLTGLSVRAKNVFQFIQQSKETTAGHVRKFLGVPSNDLNNDPAYKALAELQSCMLVDRGPFQMNEKGIPYLSKEGYPYHCFHMAHKELVTASLQLSRKEAATRFLAGYLRGAIFISDKKLNALFKTFLNEKDVEESLNYLQQTGIVSAEVLNKKNIIFTRK